MPDNLPASDHAFFALPDHQLIALDGPDAGAFAHAQFANEVLLLAPGHWQWNAWLTPKGRVITLFALIKQDQDRLLLLLPDGNAAELALQLQRFVFRRKLKVVARQDLQVSGAFIAGEPAESARIQAQDNCIALDYGTASEPRTLRIGPPESRVANEPALAAQWDAYDLRHGLPHLAPAQREQWTPQQLSLERLHAFSVKKGCYPGQEIVARTHFLGKAKRGLALFETDKPVAPGSEVGDGQRSIGVVVSACPVASGGLALAVLPLQREPVALFADCNGLREIPLLDGLQR